MRKGWIIAIIVASIILFGLGVFLGISTNQKKTQDSNKLTKQLAEDNNIISNEAVFTSVVDSNISPNCTIVEKQYYNGCDHIIKEIKDVPEEWVNKSEEYIKEQIEIEYSDWKLEDFSNTQIIVSQEKDGYCPQHYVIKDHNGVIGIYTLDEKGNETFKEDTEIATMYLPDEDMEKLKEGIKAIGDDGLHVVLSDFE